MMILACATPWRLGRCLICFCWPAERASKDTTDCAEIDAGEARARAPTGVFAKPKKGSERYSSGMFIWRARLARARATRVLPAARLDAATATEVRL